MFFRRIESEGLAHHSYYIAEGGEAVIIDPRRDVDAYLDLARGRGDRVRYVLETHRNEDYAIGSTALAAATGAEILHGSRLAFEYGTPAQDGDEIGAGRLRIRVIETPGHTDESLSYALVDTDTGHDPIMVFTGDNLFVGTTGRTDLYGPDEERRLAETLYDSLFGKILPLGDQVLMYPAHGAGSVCGGGMVDRNESSLGIERRHNPSLTVADKEAFVQAKLGEKPVQPPYFKRMEEWNLKGNAPIHERLPTPPPLSTDAFAELHTRGALVIDTRMPQAFASGHIQGSYNIWLEGLAGYLGWVVPPGKDILLVLPEHAPVEQTMRTAYRIGYDEVAGYLRGGFEAWQNEGREVERHGTIDTQGLLHAREAGEGLHVLDVRKPDELDEGTVPGAQHVFVGELEDHLDEVPRDRPIVTMCTVGHRGGLAASILTRHGYRDVRNYLGAFSAWQQLKELKGG